jgi:uncharacterized protein (TIGR00369 family)
MTADTVSETIRSWLQNSPFITFMNLELVSAEVEAGEVAFRMPMRPEFERGGPVSGQFHGGPIAALIDTVGDFAVAVVVKGGVPTINFRVDYLRPAIKTKLITTATVRRNGKSVGVVDVDVFNDKRVLLAVGRATYSTMAG